MEKTMMMPAYYNVLNTEEMTYTVGGAATVTQAICAAVLPFYGWYKGSIAIRDYIKTNKNPSTWIEGGIDTFVSHMENSLVDAVYHIGCAVDFASVCTMSGGLGLIPTAIIVFATK